VLNDAGADVVKILIHEVGGVAFFLGQRTAFIAASLGVEEQPASLGGVTDGVGVASHEMVEWRVERELCAFVGCDGAFQGRLR